MPGPTSSTSRLPNPKHNRIHKAHEHNSYNRRNPAPNGCGDQCQRTGTARTRERTRTSLEHGRNQARLRGGWLCGTTDRSAPAGRRQEGQPLLSAQPAILLGIPIAHAMTIVYCKCSQRWKVRGAEGFLKLSCAGLAIGWTCCRRATGFRLKADAIQTARSFGFAEV